MTTKVTIEVPAGAKYSTQVWTETPTTTALHTVWPGEKFELYIYPGMWVTQIMESEFGLK